MLAACIAHTGTSFVVGVAETCCGISYDSGLQTPRGDPVLGCAPIRRQDDIPRARIPWAHCNMPIEIGSAEGECFLHCTNRLCVLCIYIPYDNHVACQAWALHASSAQRGFQRHPRYCCAVISPAVHTPSGRMAVAPVIPGTHRCLRAAVSGQVGVARGGIVPPLCMVIWNSTGTRNSGGR
jgi:hypothetical protein